MKYIFIIQGEGRGHMTQAISLAQALEDKGYEVSEVFLGVSPQRSPPGFLTDYFGRRLRYFNSPNFICTSDKKGINIGLSFIYNLIRAPIYLCEIFRLSAFIRKSDSEVIINFFDIIGGLAYYLSFSGKRFYVISHHYFFSHPDFTWPEKFTIQRSLLKIYSCLCALGAKRIIALSFRKARNIEKRRLFVIPPLLRREVYKLQPSDSGFILVYLLNPGMMHEIISWCSSHQHVRVVVFADCIPDELTFPPNLQFEHLSGQKFLDALTGCSLIFCTAGFETLAEAAYLGKKILVIPTLNHFEQECNAWDAERTGIAINTDKFDPFIHAGGTGNHTAIDSVKPWFTKNPAMITELI